MRTWLMYIAWVIGALLVIAIFLGVVAFFTGFDLDELSIMLFALERHSLDIVIATLCIFIVVLLIVIAWVRWGSPVNWVLKSINWLRGLWSRRSGQKAGT